MKPTPKKPEKATRTSTAVAKRDTAAVAPLSSLLQQNAGDGLETVGRDDMAIPFIGLLQSLSPQRMRNDPKHIPGAEEGMFFNTVTNELFKEDVLVVPVAYEKVFNVWTDRDAGGGFIGSYKSKAEAEAHCDTDEQQQVVDTANHYVLVKTENGWEPALLSWTGTKHKASRNWNSLMSMATVKDANGRPFVPPIYARIYRISAVQQKNDKGVFYVPQVKPDEWVDAKLYDLAQQFRATIKQGGAKIEYTQAKDDQLDGSDTTPF